MNSPSDPFGARSTIDTELGERVIYRLDALASAAGSVPVSSMPYSIRVLLEALLRNHDAYVVTGEHVRALASYDARKVAGVEIPHRPGRVVLQDFTGVPAIVDLAAMRSAIVRMTGRAADARKVNPLVPCDLVVDHSVQVDAFATGTALAINSEKEFVRNRERYTFLKWGQQAFDNFRVVPPATGIVHQVNLEYLARVVWEGPDPAGGTALYPDSLVGTDSHTTMINGLGVVGWGVGGIEAEAVMLGQPIYMLIPQVVGVKLTGRLVEGVTATDLVLRVTELLRSHGVVGKFVEFFGPGLAEMPLANRATIANMAPEYGATMGYFPVDDRTIEYLRLTGRPEESVRTVERYCRENFLWRDDGEEIVYSEELEFELSTVVPSLAGPKRPQDRIDLGAMRPRWREVLGGLGKSAPSGAEKASEAAAVALAEDPGEEGVEVSFEGETFRLGHGAVVIAAITSCTNTSNPEVMVAAGLLARKARQRGLTRKPWVKTSLAPGSKVVTEYYDRSGLTGDLEALGFYTVGYGCTTCIGNSGPLPGPIAEAVRENDLVVCSVLSGNRNFEGRVSPLTRANYLASPPLVVAYAIAGTVDIDLQNDPLGTDPSGREVFLRDVWPSASEIQEVVTSSLSRDQFTERYADVFAGAAEWRAIQGATGDLYEWDQNSTYIQEPPFFVDLTPEPRPIRAIRAARVLCKLADSVTTDHISPAGSIAPGTPAAQYLDAAGVPGELYNSLGSRRGNDRVMTRATFANVRVKNQLAPGAEGGFTTDFTLSPGSDEARALAGRYPDFERVGTEGIGGGVISFIYDAVQNYKAADTPLVVLAGTDYGMGSSRDWAAKGTFLLNVKVVIASSFERIHRSNLVGMGVLPLEFQGGDTHESLSLDGTESFDIEVDDGIRPRQDIAVTATRADGTKIEFRTTCRIDTPVEVDYYRNGGILHTVLRRMARA